MAHRSGHPLKKRRHKQQLNNRFTPEMIASLGELAAASHMPRTKLLEDLFWDHADTAAQRYMQWTEWSLPRLIEAFLARKRAQGLAAEVIRCAVSE